MIDNILISALDVAANGSTAATSYDSNSVCNINWTQFIPTMIATVIAFGLTILGTYLYDNYVERKEKKEFIINLRNELNDMLASLSDTQTKLLDKEEIYSYVKKNNLIYFEDKSNHEDDFLRNRIRHHVVPLLKKESPSVGEKFEEYSIQAHEAFQFIRGLSKAYLKENKDSLIVDSFNKLDIALKKDIIALMLEKYNIRKNKEIVLNILSLMEDNHGTKTIHLEGEYVFSRSYTIGKIKKEVVNNDIIYKMNKDDIIVIGKYKFYFTNSHNNICTKSIKLCYNVLEFPLTIRYKKKGDSINLAVGTKKVSRILIDKKVPKEDRLSIPIIENGNGEILWVYDYAKSDFVSKQKNTGDIYLVCEVLNHDE